MVRYYRRIKPYLYVLPLVFLFAMGVLYRTTITTASVQASPPACDSRETTGMIDTAARLGLFEGASVGVPSEAIAENTETTRVLGVADPAERWVEVDLSEQKLRAWDGDTLFLETAVSTGLPGTPTPVGEFHVWMKLRATRMEGGEGRGYYNLPNVPYVMFFQNDKVNAGLGYGLHGTYWHNEFGTQRSHGCVNLPTPVAQSLYEWTTPVLADGQKIVRASDDNPGTRIVIHD